MQILGFGIQNSPQGILNLLMTGNKKPNSSEKGYRIQYLEKGIHNVDSRIQNCLGQLPYMG